MLVHERQARILDLLSRRPSSSVAQLHKRLRVSRSTLRRDLVELEERGDLLRVHGGVVHRDSLRGEPSYDRRGEEATDAKRAIAAAAAALVEPNSVVYIDAGTTCVEVGRQLAARDDVKVFTHSIRLLVEAGGCAAAITCVGGEYRHVSQALVGGLSLDWLDRLRFDIAFIGASGLSVSDGASTTETGEAALKRQIIERSGRSVVVADARKWAKPAAVCFAPWATIDTCVTDGGIRPGDVRRLRSAGTRIIMTDKEANTA